MSIGGRHTGALADSDWTCRVLVGHLKPNTTHWYRFVESEGVGTRIGRTRTAPRKSADYRARFAFIGCQNVTQGPQNVYRRVVEDEPAAPDQRLGVSFRVRVHFRWRLVGRCLSKQCC